MTSLLVPNVNLTENTGSLSAFGGVRGSLPIYMIGTAAAGTAGVEYELVSEAQAISTFGASTAYGANLLRMIKRAFKE